MKTIKNACPRCGSLHTKKNGTTLQDKQRYRCKECGRQFLFALDYSYEAYSYEAYSYEAYSYEAYSYEAYSYEACNPLCRRLIVRRTLNGSGIRDIARTLEISSTTVLKVLRQSAEQTPEPTPPKRIQNLEIDEQWSFVQRKKQQNWLWYALDRQNGEIIAFVLGRRIGQTYWADVLGRRIGQTYWADVLGRRIGQTYWADVLGRRIGQTYWADVLGRRIGQTYWADVLGRRIGQTYWADVLGRRIGQTYWADVLGRRIGQTYWADVLGRRTDASCKKLIQKLTPCQVQNFYTNHWKSYPKFLNAKQHHIGKDGTQNIERKNLNFRTHLKRLQRRTICFSKSKQIQANPSKSKQIQANPSKSKQMHYNILKLYIHALYSNQHHF